jgi:hypothetical protein
MGMNEAASFEVLVVHFVYNQIRVLKSRTCGIPDEFQNTQQECLGLIARVKLKRNSPFLSRGRKQCAMRENGSKRYWNTGVHLKGRRRPAGIS